MRKTLGVAGALIAMFACGHHRAQAQDMPLLTKAVSIYRYANVAGTRTKVRRNGTVTSTRSQATGVRIVDDLVLVNAHTLKDADGCRVDGEPARILAIDTLHDLALLEGKYADKAPWVQLADAHPGDTVYGMSNADGVDRFMTHHFVSKLDARFLYLQEPTIPGESGTGFFDRNGALVGFAMQDRPVKNTSGAITVLYGQAIPARVIAEFLLRSFPGAPISVSP